jgi:hypothetical protein
MLATMAELDPSTDFARVPAAAVISACLSAQASVPSRSALAKLFGRSPLSTDSRPWYLGALGERRVAKRLDALGADWTVLHSVPIGEHGSDIDHVVVGPSGLFTINSKLHQNARVWVGSRRLLVNGHPTDHLRNARFESQRVARLMTTATGVATTVTPIIAIVGARDITFTERPADVVVLRDADLTWWLKRRPPALDPGDREPLASAVTQPETWMRQPAASAAEDVTAFDALHREVKQARSVRVLWGAAALIASVGVAVSLAGNAYSSLISTVVGN